MKVTDKVRNMLIHASGTSKLLVGPDLMASIENEGALLTSHGMLRGLPLVECHALLPDAMLFLDRNGNPLAMFRQSEMP